MRFLILLTFFVLGSLPTPATRAGEPEALVRDIEGKWKGRIVRDEKESDRPVVEIIFHCDSDVPDAVIEKLTAFPSLRKLGLIGGQKLTNKGLEHIGKLAGLEDLSLRNSIVTADALKHLAQLPNLKTLFLWDVRLPKDEVQTLFPNVTVKWR